MVTLRRDIAASKKSKTYDKSNLTAYDLFMEKKSNYYGTPDNSIHSMENALSFDDNSLLSYKTSSNARSYDDYDNYMLNQLKREAPSEILDKENFYKQRKSQISYENVAIATKTTAQAAATKKFTKQSKIFIVIYVLVVAIIASIILAVNRVPGPKADASSIDDSAVSSILPLDIDGEDVSSNWFDKLLDGISNA